ncbi:uncharacterized protein [Primulina eburnea]|uniref:uncharacterized protein n=1 Tax=Primulina eburnea TaxID=1245227 RepID=UPI003C6C20C4
MHHPGTRKRDLAPSGDSPVSVKLPKMETQGSLKLKQDSVTVPQKSQSSKTKAAPKVASTRNITPKLQTVGRRYHTRHSTKLISGPSNTFDDPIILGEDDPHPVQPSPKDSSIKISDNNQALDTDFNSATSGQGAPHAGISGVKLDGDPGDFGKRTNDFLAEDDAFVLRKFLSTVSFSPNSPSSLPTVATPSMVISFDCFSVL